MAFMPILLPVVAFQAERLTQASLLNPEDDYQSQE